jgi:hypothetical protein
MPREIYPKTFANPRFNQCRQFQRRLVSLVTYKDGNSSPLVESLLFSAVLLQNNSFSGW